MVLFGVSFLFEKFISVGNQIFSVGLSFILKSMFTSFSEYNFHTNVNPGFLAGGGAEILMVGVLLVVPCAMGRIGAAPPPPSL